jgi:hypothetical protein
MIDSVVRLMDRFRGGGDHALSIPSLDGAFRPNNMIEEADVLVEATAPDNVTIIGGMLHFSSGGDLLRLGADGRIEVVDRGARSGTPITVFSLDGTKAVTGFQTAWAGDVTAMTFLPDGTLATTIGAAGRTVDDWQQDFMMRGRTGSVWTMSPEGAARRIADDLAYPYGVVSDGAGGLAVSTAWDAALIRIDSSGRRRPLLENLPGYPARIVPAEDGGYWLAVFAPRNQLVEFVLRETLYRKRMMAEIAPEYWVCPTLAPAESPLEVMQDGAQKIGGSIKPWAPSLSYGMLLKLHRDFQPERSLHSRANCKRHGITSVAVRAGELIAGSVGGNAILRIPAG